MGALESLTSVSLLGQAGLVLILFITSIVLSHSKTKIPPGFVFFSFSMVTCFLGVCPSKILLESVLNRVTASLFFLYLIIHAVVQSGFIYQVMDFLVHSSKNRSLKLYLGFSFFASIIPSKKVQRQMITFLRKALPHYPLLSSAYFPSVFTLATCITMIGSITNLVADEILSDVLGGSHIGFFAFGSVSVPLFFLSVVFFMWAARKQGEYDLKDKRKPSKMLTLFLQPAKRVKEMVPVFALKSSFSRNVRVDHRVEQNSFAGTSSIEKGNEEPAVEAKQNKKSYVVGSVFLLLIASVVIGIPLVISSFVAALCLFFLGFFRRKDVFYSLPWDVFLLVISGFVFAEAFVSSHVSSLLAGYIEQLCGGSTFYILSLFLLLSAGFSFVMPSVLVVSFLLPVAAAVFSSSSTKLMELNMAAITLGSFFFFPRRLSYSLEKQAHIKEEGSESILLQMLWVIMVYFVFLIHWYIVTFID